MVSDDLPVKNDWWITAIYPRLWPECLAGVSLCQQKSGISFPIAMESHLFGSPKPQPGDFFTGVLHVSEHADMNPISLNPIEFI